MNKKPISIYSKGPIILFLIFPFFAMIFSLKYAAKKWAKNIFWLFCIFFGYTMIVESVDDTAEGADNIRYKEWFVSLAKEDISSNNFIGLLYSGGETGVDANYLDIVQPLVTFLLSRITNNYHILFAAFAFIYGFFYSRNIWYLLERIETKQSTIITLFIATFMLICPIWNINNFRFYTAAQMFLYGAIPYLVEGKKRKLLFSGASILTHFTFILPVFILGIYKLAGNKRVLFFIFFIATSLGQEFNIGNVNDSLNQLPDIFQARVKGYTNEDFQQETQVSISATNWYVKYNGLFLKWIVYAFVIAIFFRGKAVIERNSGLLNLFCFGMLFYSIVNIVSTLPEGERFYTIGNLLVFFLIIYFTAHAGIIGKKIIYYLSIAAVPLLVITSLVAIRRGFDFAGIFTIIGNPLMVPFIEDDISLIHLIK